MLTCRLCGRPIAVPASKCPWCGGTIMVICASCKQYTDDQEPLCQHCGAPLLPDTMGEVRARATLDAEVAELAADQARAHLVFSGVVAQYLRGFFYDDGQRRTVLVDLFGGPPDNNREAAALLFAAIACLVQEGYCSLEPIAGEEGFLWAEVRRWDGQARSLEGGLARQAGTGKTIRQVVDRLVAEEMGFRFEVLRPPRVRLPGMRNRTEVRDLSARSATTAVIQLGRQTALPAHQEVQACRETYRQLAEFVRTDPARARRVAEEIVEVLDWFRRYEEDPTIGLAR